MAIVKEWLESGRGEGLLKPEVGPGGEGPEAMEATAPSFEPLKDSAAVAAASFPTIFKEEPWRRRVGFAPVFNFGDGGLPKLLPATGGPPAMPSCWCGE